VVKVVVGNSRSGKEVITLLFNQWRDDVEIMNKVAEAAAENEVMTPLLEQQRAGI